MKVQVRVSVEDEGRKVTASATISGAEGYGREPINGGVEKALQGAGKMIDTALRTPRP